MQNQDQIKNNEKSAPLGFGDFDDLEFKPLTEGLGFNERKPPIQRPSTQINKPKQGKTSPGKQVKVESTARQYPHDLRAFYQNQPEIKKPTIEKKLESKLINKKKPEDLLGSWYAGLGAWFIDLVAIFVVVAITIIPMFLIIGVPIQKYGWPQLVADFAPLAGWLFVSFFILYFTFLDLAIGGTLGRIACNLKLVKEDGKDVDYKITTVRAFASLFSLIALSIPLILDFHGRISGTKLIRRK